MLCLNVLLTAKDPADVPKIRELLTAAMRQSRAEPGCRRFDVYHSSVEPRRFTLVEHWENQAALDQHRTDAATSGTPVLAPISGTVTRRRVASASVTQRVRP